jgi:hypothetical protein
MNGASDGTGNDDFARHKKSLAKKQGRSVKVKWWFMWAGLSSAFFYGTKKSGSAVL